jgi:hypothetical protein
MKNRINVQDLWEFYKDRGIELYQWRPRETDEIGISQMFRGPDRADTLIICPFTGFPIKYYSFDLMVWMENKRGLENFFSQLTEHYYAEWYNDEKRKRWYGTFDRNAPKVKLVKNIEEYTQFDPEVLQRMELYPGIEYCPEGVDPEVWFWYYEHYISLDYVEDNYNWQLPLDIVVAPSVLQNPEGSEESSYELAHESDSDEVANYLRDNPLNDDTDAEEDPYNMSSKESDSEEN